MNTPWLRKAAQYILKDTGEANESPKLIVVIRILLLSMLFYIVINSIIYISILNNIGFVFLLASLIMFVLIFGMTYHRKTTAVVYTLNLSMAAWIVGNILYLGWDTGVQHFIIVLLVLSFFFQLFQLWRKGFLCSNTMLFSYLSVLLMPQQRSYYHAYQLYDQSFTDHQYDSHFLVLIHDCLYFQQGLSDFRGQVGRI